MTEFSDKSLMDQFKASIDKIYKNLIDKVELTSIASKFKIEIANDEFSLQKRKVLRFLLHHVTREIEDQQYIAMLQETESWFQNSSLNGYTCIYTGCLFVGEQHRDYVREVFQQ